MKIAIEGCCHGELDAIYASLSRLESQHSQKVDLLLIGGDFQAIRNHADMSCIAMPEKYRRLGDFAAYYNGKKTAPVLTIFIGGNHEASNYLRELFYGGWIAPNIYYLGSSGCITYRGLRIAGLSGIYKRYSYKQGYHERLPYTEDTKRSIYHIREFDVQKLSMLDSPTIVMSHDWPTNIHRFGDSRWLLNRKPHFKDDIERGELGSQPAEMLLNKLRPQYWFSAHLHVKFAAYVEHNSSEKAEEEEGEIALDDSDEGDKRDKRPGAEGESGQVKGEQVARNASTTTRFLALDKCLPHRDFLQVLDVEKDEHVPYSDELCYDAQWLAITKTLHPHLSITLRQQPLPPENELQEKLSENLQWVNDNVKDLRIPQNFESVAPIHDEMDPPPSRKQPPFYENPQTQAFCNMLELDASKLPR